MSRPVFRKGCISMMAVLMLLLAACGGQAEQSAGVATSEAGSGDLYTMAPVKKVTRTVEPAISRTPRPTNTRVLPQTPLATADPNRLSRADVPRVEVAEAKAKLDAGEAIMVDVRSAAAYEFSHIAGALSMPGTEVVKRIGELDEDKLVIFY